MVDFFLEWLGFFAVLLLCFFIPMVVVAAIVNGATYHKRPDGTRPAWLDVVYYYLGICLFLAFISAAF